MRHLFLIIFLFPILINAQNTSNENLRITNKKVPAETSMIEVRVKTGVDNPDLRTMYYFEDILQSEFSMKGNSIEGKYIVLRVKEFLDGELIDTRILFDERGAKPFAIDSSETSFKILSKIGKEDLKLYMKEKRYGSKKAYYPLTHDNGRYVAKDFFGANQVLKEDISAPFYLMAIITPSRNPDGSSSYCRVSQSEIDPENFGKEFNIPHYYLLEMEITE